ncbi:uncharacterized protein L203_100008 [Cryptococcus depauperatus CBS 7841]|uniref:Uncharacterized protein n=1 Tax=Cryptococcus depauperatus CBS 7841 TaxID=1295531 RepID=A0AAJ8LY23_9TREE
MRCPFWGGKQASPPPTPEKKPKKAKVSADGVPLRARFLLDDNDNPVSTKATAQNTSVQRGEAPLGTKAGIPPIKIVDYHALIRRPSSQLTDSANKPCACNVDITAAVLPAMTFNTTVTIPGRSGGAALNKPSKSKPLSSLKKQQDTKLTIPVSADLEGDDKGNEASFSRWRDYTNSKFNKILGKGASKDDERDELPIPPSLSRTKYGKKTQETGIGKRSVKKAPMKKTRFLTPYTPIPGSVPPPRSERYAYAPALTDIEYRSKKRFHDKMHKGGLPRPMAGFPYSQPNNPYLHPTDMFNPMMFNPMMGGYPMGTMGMPMGMGMPLASPIPGVMPGMPGVGNLPRGYFGRDHLGRDFAGPGGVGSSQPYRPPDPSALPPMPFGLPFIARPGQEGFDQYGRMLPPALPEGWDGWGRPIVAPGANPPPTQAPPVQPNPPPMAPPTQTRDMPIGPQTGQGVSAYGYPSQTGSQSGPLTSSDQTDRPDQPACFDRPPAKQDSYYRYEPFEAFSFSADMLNHPHQLHLPPSLVNRDVNGQDWGRFIEDLSREALHGATHSLIRQARGEHTGPDPVLSDAVHSLLASWAVAFFAPRGVRVYAAHEGKKVIPPPVEPLAYKRGFSYASEWSDTESSSDDFGFGSEDDEERVARKADIYLPKREREIRRNERRRTRRRERRKGLRDSELRNGERRGNWEIHFVPATPTIWQPGARPRTYGEPVVRLRRS